MKKILLMIFLVISLNAETLIEYKKSVKAEVKNFYNELYKYIPNDSIIAREMIFLIQLDNSRTTREVDVITLNFLFKRQDILMRIVNSQNKNGR